MNARYKNITMTSKTYPKSIWCVAASVVEATLWTYSGQIKRSGTRHFTSGTTVYCLPPLWQNHYENLTVLGPHRQTMRYIMVIMPANQLTDWQVIHLEYPQLIAELCGFSNTLYQWDSEQESRDHAEQLVQRLSSNAYYSDNSN